MSVVFLPRFLGTFCRKPSLPWALAPSGASWRCETHSHPRTPVAWRRCGKPARAPQASGFFIALFCYLRLFLSGQPPGKRAMDRPTVALETLITPLCASSKASRCSSRVRSSLFSRCEGSHSWSAAPFTLGRPGIGLGSTSPLSRRLLSQRLMVGTDTEKVLATSSLGTPRSTAASTLNLRSFEYGFMFRG